MYRYTRKTFALMAPRTIAITVKYRYTLDGCLAMQWSANIKKMIISYVTSINYI